MARRTELKSKTDERNFPVRVKVRVPRNGFGNQLGEMMHFLNTQFGHTKAARHSAQVVGGQGCAFYFVDLPSAVVFFDEYPLLEMADGTRQ
ncbi:hypothetical protein N9M66_00395 [Litoreibacter sp.]|nr:hypothetical protein [Litoreibacter sp.]